MDNEPALFIPLKKHWFEAFLRGVKDTEYRPYGPRWNEKTCRIGRRVTLSCGYGKHRRISGEIIGFAVVGSEANTAIRTVYKTGDKFSAIKIKRQP